MLEELVERPDGVVDDGDEFLPRQDEVHLTGVGLLLPLVEDREVEHHVEVADVAVHPGPQGWTGELLGHEGVEAQVAGEPLEVGGRGLEEMVPLQSPGLDGLHRDACSGATGGALGHIIPAMRGPRNC